MIHVLIAPIAVVAFGLSFATDDDCRHCNHGSGSFGHYDDAIVMFTDAGFRGEAMIADESIRNLHRLGFGDEISSFFVPDGFTATFYGRKRFQGRRFTVEGPTVVRRIDCSWNDRISSVEIVRTCDSRPHRPTKIDKPKKRRIADRKVTIRSRSNR